MKEKLKPLRCVGISIAKGCGIQDMRWVLTSYEIVRTIIRLVHDLKMKVIAEGVETVGQLTQLRKLKCEYAQGYFFSKPVDSKTAEALITAPPYILAD